MYDLMLVTSVVGDGTATLPTWMGDVSTALSGLTSTAESIASVVVPIIVSVMGIVVGIRLLKKFIGKI